VAALIFACHWASAEQAGKNAAPAGAAPSRAIEIDGLGKGTFKLSGPWYFHPGDDTAWASPAFDDSGWEPISAELPWGSEGHAHLIGFAWYRCRIRITSAPGVPADFSILVPEVDDAYEIYWNGALVGRDGKLPPNPVWYLSQPDQTYDLGPVREGVLAVRVWKAPLLSDDSGNVGGFKSAPEIGSRNDIAAALDAANYSWLESEQVHLGSNLLCAAIAFLSFLLWLRTPSRWVLFWTAGFAFAPPAMQFLLNAHMGLSYTFAMGLAQPLTAVQDISLWFLLRWLLLIHDNRAISRITRVLAGISLLSQSLDGVLVAISWRTDLIRFVQFTDALTAVIYTVLIPFPLVLIVYAVARGGKLGAARWTLAILAFLDAMIIVFRNLIKQGRQYTDWTIASRIDAPLFTIHGSAISISTLSGAVLLVAIVYAVYNSVREDQLRQTALEREKMELMLESGRMRHHAEHDGLTGLLNHRVIVERLHEEISRALREGTSLSVVLIDVDQFKAVNDKYGHLAGDLVLKELSLILTRSLRPYDCVGRYGGEEFLLILPNCGIESAVNRAEQLRQTVQSTRIKDGATTLEVTASFGVAPAWPPQQDVEAVIRSVDTALYRAKSSGRNCVIRSEEPAPMQGSQAPSFASPS